MAATKLEQFGFNAIKGKASRTKAFIGTDRYIDRDTKKPALCQIKGCEEGVNWLIAINGKGRVFCFEHGEDV